MTGHPPATLHQADLARAASDAERTEGLKKYLCNISIIM